MLLNVIGCGVDGISAGSFVATQLQVAPKALGRDMAESKAWPDATIEFGSLFPCGWSAHFPTTSGICPDKSRTQTGVRQKESNVEMPTRVPTPPPTTSI